MTGKGRGLGFLFPVLAGVLVLAAGAWWRLQRSTGLPAEPPVGSANDAEGTVAEPLAASPSFPGRRELGGPEAPADVTVVPIGEARTLGAGHRLRVLEYEATLRARPSAAGGDLVVDAARIEVCAGDESWTGGALPAAFRLAYPRPEGGFDLRPASSGLAVKKPALSTRLAGDRVAAGDCRKGWVAFALGEPDAFDDRLPRSILFDNQDLDFVPPAGRGRAAWRVGE